MRADEGIQDEKLTDDVDDEQELDEQVQRRHVAAVVFAVEAKTAKSPRRLQVALNIQTVLNVMSHQLGVFLAGVVRNVADIHRRIDQGLNVDSCKNPTINEIFQLNQAVFINYLIAN